MSRAALVVLLAVLGGCAPRARPVTRAGWAEASRDCSHGDAGACMWVGSSRESSGDFVEAAKLYDSACEAGVANACAAFAYLLGEGKGVTRDLARATALEERACEGGSAHGCHSLGVAYFRGRGVARDLVRSTRLYERACAAGWLAACRDLGNALSEGRAGPVDLVGARKVWRQSCPVEDVSCTQLARSLREEKAAEAMAIVKEGCRAGGSDSCYWAGIWLDKEAKLELSVRYLRTGCAWGGEDACASFGTVLEKYAPTNDAEGALLWGESCARGRNEACFRLARQRLKRGGSRETAHAEFERLCRSGFEASCEWLCLTEKGNPVKDACEAACALGVTAKCAAATPASP